MGGWCFGRKALRRATPPRQHDRKAPHGAFCFLGGPSGPFLFVGPQTVTQSMRERLIGLVEPVLGRLGYELVDLEFGAGHGRAQVRLFIDAPAGVGVEDCAQVSRETSALLEAEDPVPTAYTLEESSPGFDRVLRRPASFGRFVGARVFVELKEPRAGRRRYTGMLLGVDEAGIALEVDRERVAVVFGEIGKARLAS